LALHADSLSVHFYLCRASDKCVKERQKTINGDDIIWSLGTLGFEEYIEPLKIYLNNYREVSF
jgi:nuclear transcription Y subunit beta